MSSFPPSAATDPNLPHDSLVPHVLGICSAMLALVTVVVAARFWIRLQLVRGRLGGDDWCILVAWLLAVGFDLDPINQTKFGLGRHIYDLPSTTNFSASLELYYFGEIVYYICVAVTKVAILNLYLRLAVDRAYRNLIWAAMAFVVVTSTACVMASIFQCIPVHKAWDVTGTVRGHCFDVNALFFANAGLDIFQDALIYVLPMRMLYKIQIPRRQKIALMGVFAVGGFVVITGMIRLNSLKVAQNTSDPSYNNYGAAVWSSIESNIGVVCASLPNFKPLFDRYFPSLMGHNRNASKNTPGGDSSSGKRSYMQRLGDSEVELEHGTGWKDSYPSVYDSDFNHDVSTSASAEGGHRFGVNSNCNHLSGSDTPHQNRGIWKSTSMVVSHE